MFSSRYPCDWEPEFDHHGNVLNDIPFKAPDAVIFLKSAIQGEFVDTDKGSFKQLSLRIPLGLYADIEAISQSGTLSRNDVLVTLLSAGQSLLNEHISDPTRLKLNRIARETLASEKADIEKKTLTTGESNATDDR